MRVQLIFDGGVYIPSSVQDCIRLEDRIKSKPTCYVVRALNRCLEPRFEGE